MSTLLHLSSCSGYKYKDDWILGKTSSEIEEKYGEFYLSPTDSEYIKDGNYVSCACAYKIREKRVGFMGTDPEMFYRIYFDADGKAYKVDDEWYIPGG